MMFTCQVCGRDLDEAMMDPDYLDVCQGCVSEFRGDSNAVSTEVENKPVVAHNDESNYLDICEKNEMKPYERQIGETDPAWSLWLAYSSQYPMAKPSLRSAAESIGMPYSTARNHMAKWKYSVRLQHYKAYCDEQLRTERAEKMRSLNEKNYSLASKLHEKLAIAVEEVDAHVLAADPRQLIAVAKLATELEEKVILDDKRNELAEYSPANTGAQKSEKTAVKTSDMESILGILSKAGMLGSVGIETTKTETTRVVAKGDEY